MFPAFGTMFMNEFNVTNFDYIFPQTYGGTYVSDIQKLGVSNSKIFNACHTEGASSEENENKVCLQSVTDAEGLGGVFNWRMDANFNNSIWDWGWNGINQLHNLLQK